MNGRSDTRREPGTSFTSTPAPPISHSTWVVLATYTKPLTFITANSNQDNRRCDKLSGDQDLPPAAERRVAVYAGRNLRGRKKCVWLLYRPDRQASLYNTTG